MPAGLGRQEALELLRAGIEAYAPLRDETWRDFGDFTALKRMSPGESFSSAGAVPDAFGFVCVGLLRAYTTTAEGSEYNKTFFQEGSFPGSMVALLTQSPSRLTVEAVEDSWVLRIRFAGFRRLLERSPDLMLFQIRYLEKNWVIAKFPREVALVQESATERYLQFRRDHPGLEARLPQYHIASHIGVTPTQLSRIRRQLPESEKSRPHRHR